MIAVDTSVLVAAFASWHEEHERAAQAVPGAEVVGHALIETYSVLTRLPAPHRAPPDVAASFLDQVSASEPLVLSRAAWRHLPARLAGLGITGGASYDALIAATVQEHDAELVTLDVRAVQTYRALGTRFRLLA